MSVKIPEELPKGLTKMGEGTKLEDLNEPKPGAVRRFGAETPDCLKELLDISVETTTQSAGSRVAD